MALAALLDTLGLLAWRQCAAYHDRETFYRSILAGNPDAWMAHDNLGNVLRASGRRREALAEYQQTVALRPDSANAHCDLGIALIDAGRMKEGMAQYDEALLLDPNHFQAHFNLGLTLDRMGRVPEAIVEYTRALRLQPTSPEALTNLGIAFAQSGRLPQAIACAEQAARLRPDYPEAPFNLGHLPRLGRPIPGGPPRSSARRCGAGRATPARNSSWASRWSARGGGPRPSCTPGRRSGFVRATRRSEAS